MIKGTNIENLIQKYPNNIIDVGIEEEHGNRSKCNVILIYYTFI